MVVSIMLGYALFIHVSIAFEYAEIDATAYIFYTLYYLLQGDVEVSGSPTEKAILHWGIKVCLRQNFMFF